MPNTVLITGTSSGYGKATAELFLERGWNVLATMRRPDPALFAASSGRLKVLPLEVTDERSILDAISAGVTAHGAIDVWVNNAGIGLGSIVEATPDSTVREIFETNTFGMMAMVQAVIPQMRARRDGVIVNVTSSVTLAPVPLAAACTACKRMIEGFTGSLAHELGAFGTAPSWSRRAMRR